MVADVMRVNIGCGNHPLLGWINIDSDPSVRADRHLVVPPMPFNNSEVNEVFAGHFLEHLTVPEADEFLAECHRVLKPGGKLGIIVPDTREVMRRYLDPGMRGIMEYPIGMKNDVHDLDTVCRLFLYSTVQDSPHRWSYDIDTLTRRVECAGFKVTGEINRWMDPRIPVGAWYQVGVDAVRV